MMDPVDEVERLKGLVSEKDGCSVDRSRCSE